MKEMTFETIVKKLIVRHSLIPQKCSKCNHNEEIILATNCSQCGKEFSINKKTLDFAADIMKGITFKYSNLWLNKNLDTQILSLLTDVITAENQNDLKINIKKYFDFCKVNKIVIGHKDYNICILPDFKTIYFNPIEDSNFYNHFGDIEFGTPYFMGAITYLKKAYNDLYPTLWKKIKKIL